MAFDTGIALPSAEDHHAAVSEVRPSGETVDLRWETAE